MSKDLGFNEILEMLIKHNPNKKPEKIKDDLISGILSGEIRMTNNSQLDEFYGWCKHHVDVNKEATSPLNYVNLFLNSSMSEKLNPTDMPGLPNILKAMKETRVGKNFDFVLHPHFLKQAFLKKFEKGKTLYFTLNSKLRWKDDEFYFLLNNNYKILLKFCWIIVKENNHE